MNIANPVGAVLFDLDNTLFNRDLAFETWTRRFVAEHFVGHSETQQEDVVTQIQMLDAKGYRSKPLLFADVLALYLTLPYDVDALCRLFFGQWTAYMSLDAGTLRLLDVLETAGIPFGIVTNGSAQQNLKIDQLGLRSRTDCIFISEVFGCRKPDAGIFYAAAACIGVSCENILFVGDNPVLDIGGAHAVGMTTAWLHDGAAWPADLKDVQPDYVIGKLDELIPVLVREGLEA